VVCDRFDAPPPRISDGTIVEKNIRVPTRHGTGYVVNTGRVNVVNMGRACRSHDEQRGRAVRFCVTVTFLLAAPFVALDWIGWYYCV
jgi:hypothetical protein